MKRPKKYIKVKINSRKKPKLIAKIMNRPIVFPLSLESSLWGFRKGIISQVWPHGLKLIVSYIFNKTIEKNWKKRGMQHENFSRITHPSTTLAQACLTPEF